MIDWALFSPSPTSEKQPWVYWSDYRHLTVLDIKGLRCEIESTFVHVKDISGLEKPWAGAG